MRGRRQRPRGTFVNFDPRVSHDSDGSYVADGYKVVSETQANGDKGFTLGCAFAHYGNEVLNDCSITGTTSIYDDVLPVDLGCVNNTTTVINKGEYGTVYCWSHSIVNIDDAEIDTLYVSPIKGTVTIKAGTQIDTIKVDYGTSDANTTKARLENLVIDDGATIGKIVFRNYSYTVAEWKAFVAAF